MFERRLRFVAATGAVFFLFLLVTLFRMQVLSAGYWRERARETAWKTLVTSARRGAILDRTGAPLAEDRLQWDLVVRFDLLEGSAWTCSGCGRPATSTTARPPRRCPACRGTSFTADPPPDLDDLARRLGIARPDLDAAVARARDEMEDRVKREVEERQDEGLRAKEAEERARFRGWMWRAVEDAPADAVRALTLVPERYRGFDLDPEWRRVCLAEPAMASLVGRVGPVWQEEGERLHREEGYRYSEIWRMCVGRTGLEQALEDRLGAREGRRQVYRDESGERRVLPGEVPARDGEDVRLTLDAALQARMGEALAAAGAKEDATYAAFVALDPGTGEVVAIASWSRDESALYFPAESMVPGSVFKVVTALAGLESGTLDPAARFDCRGIFHGIRCHDGSHGPVDLVEALAVSCNGYFAHAADENEGTGIRLLDEWAGRLGFDGRTGIELPREAGGLIPDQEWKRRRHEQVPAHVPEAVWLPGESWQVGFGQGALLVTPLQVARVMAIVANGGRMVRPTLVLGAGGPGAAVVSPRSVGIVREGLRAVVTRGTASKTGLDRFRAAGKTGTADVRDREGRGRNMAWFAGYAPAEAPRWAFACVLGETGRYGAEAAGPVVAAFLEEVMGR